jgi:hypothetical protein
MADQSGASTELLISAMLVNTQDTFSMKPEVFS